MAGMMPDEATWDAYDSEDQDARRTRWTAVAESWLVGDDELVRKLIDPMPAELIDLDASLTDLCYGIRRVLAKHEAPENEGASLRRNRNRAGAGSGEPLGESSTRSWATRRSGSRGAR